MTEVVAEFARVLESERLFALSADVDALAEIQEQKREVLTRLLVSDAPAEETRSLREQALANIHLIRHLVVCLQGLSAPEALTYTAEGSRPLETMRRSWGSL